MGTHPIFESDFDCLTEMSQGAPDLDCGANVDEMNIQQEAGFLFENIPDISSRPAGRVRHNTIIETNLKEDADEDLPNEFVDLVDTRLTDGSFEDSFETKKALKEKIGQMFQTELDISTVPKMLGVEKNEIALTILAIFILEESALHKQAILSKEFLKGKNVDENYIEGCKDKLRNNFQN